MRNSGAQQQTYTANNVLGNERNGSKNKGNEKQQQKKHKHANFLLVLHGFCFIGFSHPHHSNILPEKFILPALVALIHGRKVMSLYFAKFCPSYTWVWKGFPGRNSLFGETLSNGGGTGCDVSLFEMQRLGRFPKSFVFLYRRNACWKKQLNRAFVWHVLC